MATWGRKRDVGRKAQHIHVRVQFARFSPWRGKSVRGLGYKGVRRQQRAQVVTSDERLLSILETLEECRAELLAGGHRDSAHLVSLAILDVKMQLHGIDDAELRALCDEMLAAGSARARDGKLPGRPRPLLRLVE
jgi:hypothetical protein